MLAVAVPVDAAVRVLATTADWGALTTRTRRRQGRRLHRDQRVAGRAPGRCKAQPRRARAQRRPRGRQRRGARGRLAAGAAAGVRQPEECEPGSTGLLRGGRAAQAASRCPRRSIARWATSTRRAIRTSSSIPATSRSSRRRWRRGSPLVDPANADYYAAREYGLPGPAGRPRSRAGGSGRAAQGRAGRRHAQATRATCSAGWAQAGCRDRAQARRAAKRGLSRGAGDGHSPRRRRG